MDDFLEGNEKSFEYANKIEKYLYGYGSISMLIFPNICSLYTDYSQKPNSNFLVAEMGAGKSAFMDIIYRSNHKYITKLPTKMYAFDLVKNLKKEDFNNKLLMHDDLIQSFGGLSRKSREQLTGFFTELLSSFHYSQLGYTTEGRCNALFGVARQYFMKNKQLFINETLLDRLTLISPKPLDDEEHDTIRDIKKYRTKNLKEVFPIIKLPLGKHKNINLDYDKLNNELFDNVCRKLTKMKIMSHTRTFDYVHNFLKGNALLNERKEVINNDLILFETLLSLHFEKTDTLSKMIIAFNHRKDWQDTELITELKINKSTFYKYKELALKLSTKK